MLLIKMVWVVLVGLIRLIPTNNGYVNIWKMA